MVVCIYNIHKTFHLHLQLCWLYYYSIIKETNTVCPKICGIKYLKYLQKDTAKPHCSGVLWGKWKSDSNQFKTNPLFSYLHHRLLTGIHKGSLVCCERLDRCVLFLRQVYWNNNCLYIKLWASSEEIRFSRLTHYMVMQSATWELERLW